MRAGPIIRLLQWGKLRHWSRGCPRDAEMAEGNSCLGEDTMQALLHKLSSALCGRGSGGSCILELLGLSTWTTFDSETIQLQCELIWSFLWSSPTKGPILEM